MKNKLSLIVMLAGAGCLSVANAQNIGVVPASPSFQALVNLMTTPNSLTSALYVQPDPGEGPDYSNFLWEGGQWYKNTAPTGTGTDAVNSLLFREIPNLAGFFTTSGVDVGFLDNESLDSNRFGVLDVNDSNTSYTLFTYSGQGQAKTPPPDTAGLALTNPNVGAPVTFWTWNPQSYNVQSDPAGFRTFFAQDLTGQVPVSFYLFRIGDRETDADFDDGFFLIAGEGLTPVPEPSTIGLLAIAGIGGLLFYRRRRAAKKA